MRKLMQELKKNLLAEQDVVMVTTVSSIGSTPRGAGAHMLVGTQGILCGTVGGGAVEYYCINKAKQVLKEKASAIETFTLRENEILDLGMVCGGDVTVYFRYVSSDEKQWLTFADQIDALFAAGDRTWLIMNLTNGQMTLQGQTVSVDKEIPESVLVSLGERPRLLEVQGQIYYTELMINSRRVWIFGGGHVSQALVPVLAHIDFRCVVIEDRSEFCKKELFPDAESILLMTSEEWETKLNIRPDDYICIMTRGHKQDLDCQDFALRTRAGYIGVIGSKRKIAATNARLKERGYGAEDLARIVTPIGLSIGAVTPAEIAISIAAQLIQWRAR